MAKRDPQKSLDRWTKQKWRTSDKKPSKGKKRYLPDAVLINIIIKEQSRIIEISSQNPKWLP